jgi:hypothetical protein
MIHNGTTPEGTVSMHAYCEPIQYYHVCYMVHYMDLRISWYIIEHV